MTTINPAVVPADFSAANVSRLTCPRCQRPESACVCRLATPTPHATEVLIPQHPLEALHAKNSAGLQGNMAS